MSDLVRLRNPGDTPIVFMDDEGERRVEPGEEFTVGRRTGAVLQRVTRAERVHAVAEAPAPGPGIIIPAGARTAPR